MLCKTKRLSQEEVKMGVTETPELNNWEGCPHTHGHIV